MRYPTEIPKGAEVVAIEFSEMGKTPATADCQKEYCAIMVVVQYPDHRIQDSHRDLEVTAKKGMIFRVAFEPDPASFPGSLSSGGEKEVSVWGTKFSMQELYSDKTRVDKDKGWQMASNVDLRDFRQRQALGSAELQTTFLASSVQYTEEENIAFFNTWKEISP